MNKRAENLMRRAGLTEEVLGETSRIYQVPAELILAIIEVESGGRRKAARFEPKYPYFSQVEKWARAFGWTYHTEKAFQKFSLGLMQIMFSTARDIGYEMHPMHLFDSKINISWGTLYLRRLHSMYRTWPNVISAYNQGSPKKNWRGRYRNQRYVDKVMVAWKALDD